MTILSEHLNLEGISIEHILQNKFQRDVIQNIADYIHQWVLPDLTFYRFLFYKKNRIDSDEKCAEPLFKP